MHGNWMPYGEAAEPSSTNSYCLGEIGFVSCPLCSSRSFGSKCEYISNGSFAYAVCVPESNCFGKGMSYNKNYQSQHNSLLKKLYDQKTSGGGYYISIIFTVFLWHTSLAMCRWECELKAIEGLSLNTSKIKYANWKKLKLRRKSG